ncbi:MAG: hypothetical protein NVS9B12_09940 [Vulcanimicrobiaceae bacterium]
MESLDYTSLSVRERSLVDYANVLTAEPSKVCEANVRDLRAGGLTDEAVLHACQIVAYFNFVNRMAQGLGVSLEVHDH